MIKREKRLKRKLKRHNRSSMRVMHKLKNLKIRLTTSGLLSQEEMKIKI
jgi:hypothetical protein